MPQPHLKLTSEVKYLKGVGPARAESLAGRAIHTVEDLLYYTPFRYEDRTRLTAVGDLVAGQTATLLGKVLACGLTRTRKGLYIYDLAAEDASGAAHPRIIRCKWFNAQYLERNQTFQTGQRVFFYGKVEQDPFGTGNLQIIQPQFEIIPENETAESLEVGRVVPIYESVGALGPRALRRLMRTALDSVGDQIPELLPASVRKKNSLTGRAAAFHLTHFPDGKQSFDELARFRTPPQIRLIFEELFNLSAGLALKHRKAKAIPGIQFHVTDELRRNIKSILPFHPTAAQKRVLKEIAEDMCSPRPMNRLLQGDVGSGKTIVAVQAALLA
ncbi:MAG TPA: ATP-dependent DNA helicase RecG, partial [Terriglobia bacterium]|nr:ATP-dependent DNA helicase RecG [Terriglobia bacterium]